jgi:hypothetical protein
VVDEVDYDPQIEWGFVAGLSFGQLAGEAAPTDSAMAFFNSVESKAVVGVQAGIAVSIPVTSRWEFEPQLVAHMLGPRFIYTRANGREETFRVQPLRIDFPLHVHYRNLKENTDLAVGVKPLFGLSELGNSKPGLLDYDVMADLGVRRKLHLGVGSYWLELLLSTSLINLVDPSSSVYDAWYPELRRQEITLRLHFM